MSAIKNNDTVSCTYSVHAIVFGADESLLNIQLSDGYSFEKLSLIPSRSHLDTIFETSAMNLRRDYESARINDSTMDVICAVKKIDYYKEFTSLDIQFEKDAEKDLISLDNQIRSIRLLKEGPVRFKKIAFNLVSCTSVEGYTIPCKHNSIELIGEAIKTKPISVFHCSDSDLLLFNKTLSRLTIPFLDSLINSCYMFYDLSYHTEPCVSITLLTTSLETLFLERHAYKKEKTLAKRCASFLYENDVQKREEVYRNMIAFYDKRSDFVHEGKTLNIKNADIISLRAIVRDSILKTLDLPENKDQRITRLNQIASKVTWPSVKI